MSIATPTRKILTLSVRQPWAWAIFHGKPVENRDWYTSVRGLIAIHAAKKIDKEDIEYIEGNFGFKVPVDLPTGGIVGTANLVDCVRNHPSRWFFGKFGFVLQEQKEIPFIPMRGRLGFFQAEIPQ
jgi:hypothetical protein